jgi:hypothetical protein
MKKTISLIAMIGICFLMHGQFTIQPTDTIVGRTNHYYYLPYWYDDCHYYQEDSILFNGMPIVQYMPIPTNSFDYILAEEHYAQQEMLVRGLAAMVMSTEGRRGTFSHPPTNPWRGEEKLFLLQGDADPFGLSTFLYPRLMHELDSVRWDTAAPRLMRLPLNSFVNPDDTTGYLECYVYEAMFDVPRKVRDTFYIVGTFNSNVLDPSIMYETGVFRYIPTAYRAIRAQKMYCDGCPRGTKLFIADRNSVRSSWSDWIYHNRSESTNGPFLPIIVTYSLEAMSSPAYGGTVEGTGRFPEGWRMPLTAVPAEGYAFSQWSDGSTDNPRYVDLTADTSVTAIFIAE